MCFVLKSALNWIMNCEKYRNCCIILELNKQKFGHDKYKTSCSVGLREIDLKLNTSVAFSAWVLFLNFDALISKTEQHQRSNAAEHIC